MDTNKVDPCAAVRREVDKVCAKYIAMHEHSINSLDEFISSIDSIRQELVSGLFSDNFMLSSMVTFCVCLLYYIGSYLNIDLIAF